MQVVLGGFRWFQVVPCFSNYDINLASVDIQTITIPLQQKKEDKGTLTPETRSLIKQYGYNIRDIRSWQCCVTYKTAS